MPDPDADRSTSADWTSLPEPSAVLPERYKVTKFGESGKAGGWIPAPRRDPELPAERHIAWGNLWFWALGVFAVLLVVAGIVIGHWLKGMGK